MTQSATIHWPAPAKLNLFLHITGRRADGYHLLQTVFQLLDYGDTLQFAVTADKAITRLTAIPGVAEQEDLIVRAAHLLQQYCATQQGVRIAIDKCLPMGGGLAGGSSDAATTLVALNHLWECGLDTAQLCQLGQQLGADIPVFIQGHSAWAEGVGEQLQPIELPASSYVVLIPQVNVSTGNVFSHPQLIRDCSPITIRDFLAGQGSNVCETLVRQQYPQVEQAFAALALYAQPRMTGTGACVFARFDEQAQAEQVWSELQANWQGFVAQGVNTSPLRTTLQTLTEGVSA